MVYYVTDGYNMNVSLQRSRRAQTRKQTQSEGVLSEALTAANAPSVLLNVGQPQLRSLDPQVRKDVRKDVQAVHVKL